MSHRLSSCLFAICFTSFLSIAQADTTTLYLLNGTVMRGEIIDRSAREVKLKTVSGVVKVKTARLMPISRQQLKLPAEVEKEEAVNTPEMEMVLTQMEKLLAENESLKQQVEALKRLLAPTAPTVATDPISPAEGPVSKR